MASMLYLTAVLRAVPTSHIIFVVATAAYATLANVFILHSKESLPSAPLRPRSLTPVKNIVRLLFPSTAAFSFFVPICLLVVGPTGLRGILVPHLFLMMSQILLETVGYLLFKYYTLYVRLGVTVAIVVYRLPVIMEWYEKAGQWAQTEEGKSVAPLVSALTQAAAVLNLVYWAFALFCFLLLYCLPAVVREPVFETSEKDEQKQR